MPGIDPSRPLRIKATGRQVFAVWSIWEGEHRGCFWVDLRDGSGPRGFRYNSNGHPVDEGCPWGVIENLNGHDLDPFENMEFVTPQDAYAPEKLAAKRQAEHDKMVDEMGDNSLFGMF